MWYDWEFVNSAMEDWHYANQSNLGSALYMEQSKLAQLAYAAERFSTSDKSYVGKDGFTTLQEWIERNVSGCANWLRQ